MPNYDVVIIGAGPAGLTAGLYAARRNLKTLVVGELLGGQMSYATMIENYPGFDKISGVELAEKMKKQAEKFGCEIKMEKVVDMELDGEVKSIRTPRNSYNAKAVILATGGQHKKLNVKGEDKFLGKGVSYCASCDGPLFKGKDVAVIGGGDMAAASAVYMKEFCPNVYLIHRREELRAAESEQKKLDEIGVKIILNSEVEEILGEETIQKIRIKNVKTNEISELNVSGVMIEVGQIPTTELAKKAGVKTDDNNFITTNKGQETNIKGVFAAGDATGTLAQITNSVGQGSLAATNAYFYIKKPEYKTLDYH